MIFISSRQAWFKKTSVVSWVDWVDQLLTLPWSKVKTVGISQFSVIKQWLGISLLWKLWKPKRRLETVEVFWGENHQSMIFRVSLLLAPVINYFKWFSGIFPWVSSKRIGRFAGESWDSTYQKLGFFRHTQRLCLNKWEGHPPLKTRADWGFKFIPILCWIRSWYRWTNKRKRGNITNITT